MATFDIVFYIFAAITVVSAFVVVFTRNIMYAAFSLLFTFIGVAGLYVLLHADFLAVTQILIYVGGILVLLLFGVMLTNNVVSVDIKTGTMNMLPAFFAAGTVCGTLVVVFFKAWGHVAEPATAPTATTRAIGELLMTGYALPFEVASVVLLAALLGAALMARRTRKS
jgi:NADH-quinone oxidoreductase subunit J